MQQSTSSSQEWIEGSHQQLEQQQQASLLMVLQATAAAVARQRRQHLHISSRLVAVAVAGVHRAGQWALRCRLCWNTWWVENASRCML